MKITYIEIEANADEIKANPSLAEALRDALVIATSKMKYDDTGIEEVEE